MPQRQEGARRTPPALKVPTPFGVSASFFADTSSYERAQGAAKHVGEGGWKGAVRVLSRDWWGGPGHGNEVRFKTYQEDK
jgi:hypothetical protein